MAAVFSFLVTALYLKLKSQMNGQKMENHMYIKPSLLVGLLTYFIVYYGNSHDEPILKTSPLQV